MRKITKEFIGNSPAAAEVLQLALYTSWYLAALNRVNPQAIPWVDYFKARLAQR